MKHRTTGLPLPQAREHRKRQTTWTTSQDERVCLWPYYLLCVDNGAFLFTSKDDMLKGANVLFEHFEMFGLNFHTGRNDGKSKTEAMFIPPCLIKQRTDNQPWRETHSGWWIHRHDERVQMPRFVDRRHTMHISYSNPILSRSRIRSAGMVLGFPSWCNV